MVRILIGPRFRRAPESRVLDGRVDHDNPASLSIWNARLKAFRATRELGKALLDIACCCGHCTNIVQLFESMSTVFYFSPSLVSHDILC
jgi:hypothetical protein